MLAKAILAAESSLGISMPSIADIVKSQRIIIPKLPAPTVVAENVSGVLGIDCHPKAIQVASMVVRSS